MKRNGKGTRDRRLIERLADNSQLISETLVMPRIEFNGNKDAVIDGCKGVLAYDCGTVKLNCGCLVVCFCGTNLAIRNLNFDRLVVSGDIMNVDFSS